MGTTNVLECVLCGVRYSEADVKELLYFPSTGVCKACYDAGQKKPHAIWCFGKVNLVKRQNRKKVVAYGYSEEAKECQVLCPDKTICRFYLKRKGAS